MIKSILVPLDGSELAECVLPHAVNLSRSFDARITVLHVLESASLTSISPGGSTLDWHFRRAETELYLSSITNQLKEVNIVADGDIIEGNPAIGIVEYARQHQIDLILLSSHGKSGISSWKVSGVVQKIIARSTASVFLARAKKTPANQLVGSRFQRIMVGLDGSMRAECALPVASRLALKEEAVLVLAHVTTKPFMLVREPLSEHDHILVEQVVERNFQEADRYLDKLISRFSADGIRLGKELRVGETPSSSLHRMVEDEKIDLVVFSAHGYTGDNHRLYGSVVTNFIFYGMTPLLIIQDLSDDEIRDLLIEAVDERRLP